VPGVGESLVLPRLTEVAVHRVGLATEKREPIGKSGIKFQQQ
jgi:hypothetical protein